MYKRQPYTSERAKQKVIDLAKKVARYSGQIKLHVVNFTDIQLYIYEKCPHEELTIIMRRYMMKIAAVSYTHLDVYKRQAESFLSAGKRFFRDSRAACYQRRNVLLRSREQTVP